ncbi:MAG: hypothetical protein V1750_10570 [Acidobacteriota bacterium]
MRTPSARRRHRVAVLALLAILTAAVTVFACKRRPALDPAYIAEIESWHRDRVNELTRADGWLTVVGLTWLTPGANRFGGDPANEVVLQGAGVPPLAGVLEVGADGEVVLHPQAGSGLTIAGAPATERALRRDTDGNQDILELGSLRFWIIVRGDRLAVRVKDLLRS